MLSTMIFNDQVYEKKNCQSSKYERVLEQVISHLWRRKANSNLNANCSASKYLKPARYRFNHRFFVNLSKINLPPLATLA